MIAVRDKLLLCIALLFTVVSVRAQGNQFQFSHLDINNGLSHNQVNCILKDKMGFMWFGTASGLNKYDGYKFKVFKHSVSDTTSLDDDFIISMAEGPDNKLWVQTRNGFNIYDPATERFSHNVRGYLKTINIPDSYLAFLRSDKQGNYWFLHVNQGIWLYNPLLHQTIHFKHTANSTSIHANSVADMSQDSKGNIWLAYADGMLEKLDPHKNYQVVYRSQLFSALPAGVNNSYKIFIDKQDDIWAFVPSYSSGVYYFNPVKNICRHIDKGAGNTHLNTDVISNVIQQDKNHIWVATDHGGINILDKRDFTITYLLNREDDNKTIAQNTTVVIYKDDTDIIWIGTYKHGISYYHPNIIKFTHYTHHPSDPTSISFSDINCFAEDQLHNLWIGTNGGGLIYFDRKRGTFKTYLHDTNNKNSLTNNVIVYMYLDHDQKLWIGTYFGGMDCFDGKTFTHYKHSNNPNTISEDRVCAIYEDSGHHIWVGTLAGGLNEFDRETGKFYNKITNKPDGIHSNYVSAILEDRQKNLWVVTSYGVDVLLKKTGKFMHYIHDEHNPNSLINNNTNNILQDSRGLIWISTREGISIFNPATGKFTNIYKQDGLPDNTVIDMHETDRHTVWVSTTNGLSKIMISQIGGALKFHFLNYNESDGLQGHEFNENSSYKTRAGELVFGGANGFNLFKPSEMYMNTDVPKILFTDFNVFNQQVGVGEKVMGRVVLPKSITGSDSIELKYNVNVFSITFAALNYFSPDKVKYQYMMSGFDKNWINADNKIRTATYTNLDPGEYTFKVRATNNDYWNNKVKILHISVLPPFWKTTWAYLFYTLASIGLLFFIRKRGIDKLKLQFTIEKEREEARRMHELDLMKIKFFTNVSHEFRTPLSLIMAPVDKLMKQAKDADLQRQLELINRNAKRLLHMVNQLLDFRKMEYQELQLHTKTGNIIRYIKDLCDSFNDIAYQKSIVFIFDSEVDQFYTPFDHDKVERIIFNLLSNAYKFTQTGGQVSVLLNLIPDEEETDSFTLEIKVMDTGIGIPAEKQHRIFEPFFQNDIPGSMLNQGSGIGLSISKEFVKLHNGEISVESEPGQGSCFTVSLKLVQADDSLLVDLPLEIVHEDIELIEPYHFIPEQPESKKERKDTKKLTVLLVEDNEDFRFYLKDNLKDSFNIIEAENGKKGWQKALAQHPNLIVSDISMPEMNGSDLCIKIKNDPRTTHIPVILLTALTGEEQQLKGLETGATDYMTKPFNFEILQSKIRNILYQQETMRKTYQKQVEANPTEMQVESPDELFIKKVLVLIDNNISNPNFSVEELSSEMYVSRYTLYKKILTLTGKTPNELVRSMRMKRAVQLLESGHLTISQICHKVGFKSQKYFVKLFKAEFNTIPSKYLESVEQE
ncbi:hybrid sensor histidine kinase/response regulator transcription factor [Mucilaginibacter jinjuensis]|uniref:histidine kinase n=1 Tax=Mucilaginibacter jinjuensis TaxID=1176721 RepID=A0ABY7T2R9_9SPHI|nr:hybrid sensor histidine kinase/response regulator transcription factor [Mucilaginibacter jinjuensis]WCT10745.1 two-component regulator propeller domain-containing protein [Mucilaginibacter jinjuensis]